MKESAMQNSINGNERIVLDFTKLDERFCFTLGRVNYSKAQKPLEEHIHKGMMEIVYMLKGRQSYAIENQEYIVNSGEVFITHPDEIHSTGHSPEDKSLLYYFIIDLEKCENNFIGFDKKESYAIYQSLRCIKKRVFKAHHSLRKILDSIINTYSSECSFQKTIIRNMVSDFLIKIITSSDLDKIKSNPKMQSILDYIHDHIYEDICIKTLAEVAGLSIPRFKTNFRKQVGIPPHEYILRQKVETAKNLLCHTNKSITEIAYSLSFSSSQYFSTVFKRYTFMNPAKFKTYSKNLSINLNYFQL